ncbi:hypothetical protein HB662_18165 [Roseomonas frigidaquae]|uniref:KANL3/Tex30 alpha/beta hydrolase-like domain-containing protein n=1 Tax=Falsiroseomonas frigidaquae TaxID=487318 RepID=A0ABX1F2Z0_9PROT|nr:alpha/beta family hydrolase [Falsiroseomonas frigidaquae]NKE46713.1 hypothetical protein [Falsiroseomonas frigidaquae]
MAQQATGGQVERDASGGGQLLVDGRPAFAFLAESGRMAFALSLPIVRLDWAGARSLKFLRLVRSEAVLDLPLGMDGTQLPTCPPLQAAAGRAVLIAELEDARAELESRIMFLSGDSRPKDAHFGPLVRRSLAPFFTRTFQTEGEQSDIPPDQALPRSFTERQNWLRQVLESSADPGRLILVGRSSGARVASTVADLRPVRGLVCLGYPFRQPERRDDPGRYSHLRHLRTPSLIIQGSRDAYGGADIADRYALGPNTQVVILDTDHGFRMETAGWDRVGREILLFLGHCYAVPA